MSVSLRRDDAIAVPAPAAPVAMRASNRPWTLGLLALGALGIAIGIAILDASPVGVATDDAMYVILAKSLATGQGYRFLNLPGSPAATHFPPGYPALLALLWRLAPDFPANLMLFKAANAVFLGIAAVAAARYARGRLFSDGWALVAGALTATALPLLILGAMLMSEPFFLAILLLLLPALEAFVERERPAHSRDVGRAALLGLAIGIAMLVRTHAIVLVPAMALLLVLRRRWRDAAIVTAVAVCVLAPWQLWSARHAGVLPAPLLGEYDSYLSWWVRGYHAMGPRMVALTLQRTVGETLAMFAILFSPSRSGAGHVVTLLALLGIACVGIASRWRRMSVTLLFLAGYLAIVLLWPFPSSRFVWSVWPLYLVILLAGAQRIVQALRRPAQRRHRLLQLAGATAVVWVAVGYAAYERRGVRGRWWASIPRDNTARIVPMVRWTLGNTAPTDLVAADDDGAVYLYTGRRTVPVRSFTVQQYLTVIPPRQDAEEGLAPILATYPVRAVIVGSTATLAQADWLAAQPAPLVRRIDAFPNGVAFTVLPR